MGKSTSFKKIPNDFLTVAEELQLKGLQGNETDNKYPEEEPNPVETSIRPRKKVISQSADINYTQASNVGNCQYYENKVEMTGSDDDNTALVSIDTSEKKNIND